MNFYPLLGTYIHTIDRDVLAKDACTFPKGSRCMKYGGRFVSARPGDACDCRQCRWCATWSKPDALHDCDGDPLY